MQLSYDKTPGPRGVSEIRGKDVAARSGRLRRFFQRCAVIGALLLPASLMGNAQAEEGPEQVNRPCQVIGEEGEEPVCNVITRPDAQISLRQITASEDASQSAFLVNERLDRVPEIEIEGRARVTLRFWAAVQPDSITDDTNIPVSVDFVVSREGAEDRTVPVSGSCSATDLSAFDSEGGNLLVNADGDPVRTVLTSVEETVEIEDGARISFADPVPDGFLFVEVESLPGPEPEETPPEPEPVFECTDDEDCSEIEICNILPGGQGGRCEEFFEAEVMHEDEEPGERRPLVSASFERTSFDQLGSRTLEVDANWVDIVGYVPVSDELAVPVGLAFSTLGESISLDDELSDVRSLSVDLVGGIQFRRGRHRFDAAALLGYRRTFTDFFRVMNEPATENSENDFEIGGILGYDLDPYVSVRVRLTNSTFNPISGTITGRLPYTWARRGEFAEYPALDLRLEWLCGLNEMQNVEGGVQSTEDIFRLGFMGTIPTYPIPIRSATLIFDILLGGDLNAYAGPPGAGFGSADFFPGLAARLETPVLSAFLSGVVSPLTARHEVNFGLEVRR